MPDITELQQVTIVLSDGTTGEFFGRPIVTEATAEEATVVSITFSDPFVPEDEEASDE